MKALITHLCLLSLFIVFYRSSPVSAQGTAFLYQGQLQSQGSPANGSYDLIFTLYTTNTGGTTVAGPVTNNAVSVTNGLFTVSVGFGPGVFGGSNYWLDLQVSTNAANTFMELTPRQAITPVPYAMYAPSAGSVAATNLTGPLAIAQLPASVVTNGASGVSFTGTFIGNGGGLTNLPTSGSGFTWQIITGMTEQAALNTGYIVTNGNSRVTITLPVTANVGDLVRVSGLGAGGWEIAQNDGQSIVAGNLAGSTGLSGTYWVSHDSSRNWSAIASSADGTKLIASAGNAVYRSMDSGLTWSPQNVIVTNNNTLFGIQLASSADGTKLFAMGAGITSGSGQCYLYRSTDSGVTWSGIPVTAKVDGNSYGLGDCASLSCSADGTKLVATDFDGGGSGYCSVFTSTDSGATWSAFIFQNPDFLFSTVCSADGAKLVAAGEEFGLYTSADGGTTWIQQPNWTATGTTHLASSADGTKLIAAIQNGQIYASTDSGVTWTAQTNGIPNGGVQSWWSVASSADGTKLVAAIGSYPPVASSTPGQIYVSTNSGASWSARANNLTWDGIATSADGSKLAACTYGDHIFTTGPSPVAATTSGAAGSLTGGLNTAVELQYIGSGQWLPISHEGNIFAN